MTSTCTCCDCSGTPTRHFIHENVMGCAECRLDGLHGCYSSMWMHLTCSIAISLIGEFATREPKTGVFKTIRADGGPARTNGIEDDQFVNVQRRQFFFIHLVNTIKV